MNDYNPLWDRFVGDDESETVEGYVAYAIYKKAKRQWVQEFRVRTGRAPNPDELAGYSATWTAQVAQNASDAAESALAAFAEEAVATARPSIVEEALRGEWWRSILLSIVANVIYTVLLLALVLVLKAAGVDLLSVAASAGT